MSSSAQVLSQPTGSQVKQTSRLTDGCIGWKRHYRVPRRDVTFFKLERDFRWSTGSDSSKINDVANFPDRGANLSIVGHVEPRIIRKFCNIVSLIICTKKKEED